MRPPRRFFLGATFLDRRLHAIGADKNEENSMTIIDLAIVLNAMSRLVAALSMLIRTIRGRRRP